MIVCDLDIVGITIDEPEAYAPLVVDGDGVLSFSVPTKLVQPIVWRNLKVVQARSQVNVLKLAPRPSHNIRREPFLLAGHVQFLTVFVCERLDHTPSVNRHVTIANIGRLSLSNNTDQLQAMATAQLLLVEVIWLLEIKTGHRHHLVAQAHQRPHTRRLTY